MENYIERELKILVSKEQFQKILNSYEFKKPIIQTNTYYDTDDQKIKHMNGALRIRTIENTHIFTLKIKKDSITHYEYEKEIQTTNINEIKDPEILGWIQEYDIPTNIKPITSFRTERYTYNFEHGQLCADITSYENHIDYELEYEYIDNHDGISFFNHILNNINTKYEKNCPSKIARAMNDQNLCVKR